MINEGFKTIAVLLLLVGGTVAVTFIIYTVLFYVNRIRKNEISEIRKEMKEMKVAKDHAQIKCATLTAEVITLRGIYQAARAEADALETENRMLMNKEKIVKPMRGKCIKCN